MIHLARMELGMASLLCDARRAPTLASTCPKIGTTPRRSSST